ncbi:hypothetical protein ACFQY7_47915 [Actinomadura luteofluorescens]|uniref:hypothetical protein n=1 Tax=Actinomadura luteofluorescens TaxID=46163 RepID=UPI0036341F20
MTVIFATCAAAATSAIVTRSKPCRRNRRVAWFEMLSRVCCFFISRSPMPPSSHNST